MKKVTGKMSVSKSSSGGKVPKAKSSLSSAMGFPMATKERRMKADRKLGGCR